MPHLSADTDNPLEMKQIIYLSVLAMAGHEGTVKAGCMDGVAGGKMLLII